MFEDWTRTLGALDTAELTVAEARRLLASISRHRAAVDATEARLASRVGEASVVRGATRCTQREADRAVARGQLIEALPVVGEALASGEISGAHLDTLRRAADRTSVEDLASSSLLTVARAKPADAMAKQVNEFVRKAASDADLAARLERQRSRRRAHLFSSEMGVLHAEFDDSTFGDIRAAIDAETDRLYWADGGRDGADERRTPEQRRADAVASLLLGQRPAQAGPPAVRNQALLIVHEDGTGEIPGVGPLPKSEVERLMCISDLHGLVFSADGRPLWLGDAVRLATDDQWRALIARDGGCIGCGADPSRCQAHHIVWRRHHGPTDIDNLVLVCSHHHHLIHDKGWRVVRGPDGRWTLAPP